MGKRAPWMLIGLAIACVVVVAPAIAETLPVAGDAALAISPETGRVEGLTLAGKPLAATGGFRVTDAATGESAELFAPLSDAPGGPRAAYAADELGLRLDAQFIPREGALEVACSLQDSTGEDRAVTLSFALGMDATGWRWWDDMRRSSTIGDAGVFANSLNIAHYPLCCVEDGRRALGLAIPLDRMVTHRTLYDAEARELRMEWDLGLSAATTKFPSRADVRFFVLAPDPAWGFRGALEAYYRAHPEPFSTHATTRGLWMTFHDLAKIPLAEDFHFGFHETGLHSPALNRELGVASMRYVIPGQIDVLLPFDAPKDQSFDEVEAWVRENGPERAREGLLRRLEIMRDCALEGEDGSPSRHAFYANWARGRLVYDCLVNSDPDLPVAEPHAAFMNEAVAKAAAELEAQGEALGGIYLDNFQGGQPNFRREHWASTDHPLTFRGTPPRPCTLAGIGEQEYAEHLNREHWPQGRIVFANGWREPQIFHSAVLDAGGTETFWATKQARLGPRWDWCRATMQGKVHTPLLKFDREEFNALFSHLEDYLAEATFYGFYPSLYTSGGWRYQSYWADPAMFERHREQFRLYVPVVDRLQEAGWEPATRATLSDPRLGIERYGGPEDGAFYLTVYNPLPEAQTVAVQSDLRCEAADAVAVDLLHPEVWYALDRGRVAFETTVRGMECRAFLVCGRDEAVQALWERGMSALTVVGEEPALTEALGNVRATLSDATPATDDAQLHETLKPLIELAAYRDTSYRDAGTRHYIRLRARECALHLGAALALDRGVHLDDVMPMVDELPAGTSPEPMMSRERWHGAVWLEGRGDAGLPRPHERASFGTVVDASEDAMMAVFMARSYRITWPVLLEAEVGADGAVELRATNMTGEAVEATVSAQAPEGFALTPASRQVTLAPDETQTLRFELTGPDAFAGEATVSFRAVADGQPVGWTAITVPWLQQPVNLLPQADFEGVEGAPESAVLGGSAEIVADDPRSGEACLRVSSAAATGDQMCHWSLPVEGEPPRELLVSGWSRAESVSGGVGKTYSVWVGGLTTAGGNVHLGTVQFDPGTHDWQRRSATFAVPRDLATLNVWALFRDRKGSAWFDDIFVGPSMGARGVNLASSAQATPPEAAVVIDGRVGEGAPALDLPANPDGHSLELRWEEPVQISRAVVHWPEGERRPLSSTEFALQYHDGRDWCYWALGHNYVPEQPTVLKAPPVVADRLRFVQAPQGGAIDARDELHVSEIEVF